MILTVFANDAAQELAANAQQTADKAQQWLGGLTDWAVDMIPKIIIAVLIFAIGWWISRIITNIVKKAMLKSKADLAAVTFICSFLKCTLRIIVIISAIAQLGVNVTSLLAAIGAATVTVGLALQDTMGNIASGVLIIINKPFKVGDYLEFENICGTVTKIEITNTFLTTVDNKEVIIPNKKITAGNVINYSSHDIRRVDLNFSISYDDDILKAKELIRQLVVADKKILQDRDTIIGVFSYNDSSISIDVKVWCDTEDYWDVYYDMQEKIKYLFDQNGITIPYNQVVIHSDKKM
ncbi:MAG TPA: mechanosensitive ion channel [Clostridiales bacterium]|nr:mechanosensitive ion channel [Clostridiales bacterium]